MTAVDNRYAELSLGDPTPSPSGIRPISAVPARATRRSDLPIGEVELDEHLATLVRRTSILRQGFYVVVLLVALAGQVSGAVEALHIPVAAAVPAVAALELGGIVVLANADVRRRLGERATASRLLSVAIAAGAVAFNWLAHANHLLGGFFAGMSALGYLVWLMHTENQRRDRLRVKGDLPPTTPAYEMVGHWMRHPMLTIRARAMAKADPGLGLYDSLGAARAEIRRERRQSAIAKVLHRKIRAAVDPRTADIAIAVYDLDEIADRLAERADYDGLTTLIAADLAPERLAPDGLSTPRPSRSPAPRSNDQDAAGLLDRAVTEAYQDIDGSLAAASSVDATPSAPGSGDAVGSGTARPRAAAATAPAQRPVRARLSPALREEAERALGTRAVGRRTVAETRASFSDEPPPDPIATEISLRRRVHAALDANVLPGDQRDDGELIELVFDELRLNELERLTAGTYVRSWRTENESGERIRMS
jgi:hypothetical protein